MFPSQTSGIKGIVEELINNSLLVFREKKNSTLAESDMSSQNGDKYSNSPDRIKSNNSS